MVPLSGVAANQFSYNSIKIKRHTRFAIEQNKCGTMVMNIINLLKNRCQ